MSIETLEELIKKQFPAGAQAAPRENYVIDPSAYPVASKEEMQQHFAKAKEVEKKVAASPKPQGAVQKIDESKRELEVPVGIRGYSVPQQPASQNQAPSDQTNKFLESLRQMSAGNSQAPQLPNAEYEEVKKQISEFKADRDAGGGVHWAELLGMAIPVAVGASVGQVGAPAISSGKYGIDRAAEERKKSQDYNKMLTELQSKLALAQGRQAAKSPSDPIKTFEGPDGKPYLLKVSQGQALGLPEFKEGSYQPLETEEGLIAFNKKARQQDATPFAKVGDKKDKNTEREQRLAKQFEEEQKRTATQQAIADKQYEKYRDSINNIDGLEASLQENTWAANVAAQAQFIRGILREVGNLSEQEQKRAGGSTSLFNTVGLALDRLKTGAKLTDQDRIDLAKFANVARKAYVNKANDTIQARVESEKAISGRDITPTLKPYMYDQRELRVPMTQQQKRTKYDPTTDTYTGPVRMPDGSIQIKTYRKNKGGQ